MISCKLHSDKLQQSVCGNTFVIPAQYGVQGVLKVPNNGSHLPYPAFVPKQGADAGLESSCRNRMRLLLYTRARPR